MRSWPRTPKQNYLYQQAKLRGELAELMGDGGKAKEALGVIKQAVESLQTLIDKLPSGEQTAARKEWEVQLATLHGVQGQILETTKQREADTQGLRRRRSGSISPARTRMTSRW